MEKIIRKIKQAFLGTVVTVFISLCGSAIIGSVHWVIGVNHSIAQAAQERAVITATDTANYTAINQVLQSIDHRLSNIESHLEHPPNH